MRGGGGGAGSPALQPSLSGPESCWQPCPQSYGQGWPQGKVATGHGGRQPALYILQRVPGEESPQELKRCWERLRAGGEGDDKR